MACHFNAQAAEQRREVVEPEPGVVSVRRRARLEPRLVTVYKPLVSAEAHIR
jgi:hypothetical protein